MRENSTCDLMRRVWSKPLFTLPYSYQSSFIDYSHPRAQFFCQFKDVGAEEYGPSALTAMGSAAASMPSTVAVPEVGGSWPLSICMVVVLPALLGPIKPKNSPCAIQRSRLSTAVSLPNCFVRACASIGIKKITLFYLY
jgi:hypothetical protein